MPIHDGPGSTMPIHNGLGPMGIHHQDNRKNIQMFDDVFSFFQRK